MLFKKIKIILFSLIFISLLSEIVFAHQPRFVSEKITGIENYETSQAFYGNLNGSPDIFKIESDKSFTLFVNILVPDLEVIEKNVSVLITKEDNNDFEVLLNGLDFDWSYFYEEYAGDHYYKGPEIKEYVDEGIYNIKVFSPDNYGKYVLAIGEKEEFPFNEIIKTIIIAPKLKKYFEKSPIEAFTSKIMITFSIIFLVILIVLIILIFLIIKKVLRNRKQKNENRRI